MNRTLETLRVGAVALLAMALVACGGGGGGDAAPPPPAAPTAPAITTQPQAVAVTEGQAASFAVTASGTAPLSYQWRRNGATIAGATTASYTLAAATLGDSGAQFSVVVSNSAGNVTSGDAALTVNPAIVAPAITTQPQNATVTAGQTATFTVVATGTAPLAYQWRRNGADIAGATSASYTTPATTVADSGAVFSVRISNAAPTPAVSNGATLTVNALPTAPAITTQPQNATVTAGQTATFSVVATGTAPLAYQWRRNGVDIAGATGASYTTPATTLTDSGAVFSVRVSNAAPTPAVSDGATLTVNAPPPTPTAPDITTQPQSASVPPGQTATFSVAATGTPPLSYQWRRNGTAIAGATSASYTTPATTQADNGAQFTVVVTNSVSSVTSAVATLTVTTAIGSANRVRLAASNGYTLAIRADGSVIGWGSNLFGHLGNATPLAGSAARLIGVDAVSVSGGTFEAIALGSDGIVRGWGQRSPFTLVGGDVPTSVPTIAAPRAAAFGSGIVAISVFNQQRSLALRSDGTVWSLPGEAVSTGIGSVRVEARQVVGLTDVRSLLAGGGGVGQGVAVRSDGTVWEVSISGGPSVWSATASQVPGLSDIRSASCGGLHCLALAGDGSVWAWGNNLFGMLGNNSTTSSTVPVRAIGLANVIAVAAGGASSHAITADGRVWNWGSAALSGSATPSGFVLVPTVMPNFSDAMEITAGNSVLIRRADGTVWGWGTNLRGELGDGTSGNDRSTPVEALGINLN